MPEFRAGTQSRGLCALPGLQNQTQKDPEESLCLALPTCPPHHSMHAQETEGARVSPPHKPGSNEDATMLRSLSLLIPPLSFYRPEINSSYNSRFSPAQRLPEQSAITLKLCFQPKVSPLWGPRSPFPSLISVIPPWMHCSLLKVQKKPGLWTTSFSLLVYFFWFLRQGFMLPWLAWSLAETGSKSFLFLNYIFIC